MSGRQHGLDRTVTVNRSKTHLYRLLAISVCAIDLLASSKTPADPSRFFIVSTGFSDALPGWHHSVLEVQPDGKDLLVRYIRVMPFNQDCGEATRIVWIAARLPAKSLATFTTGQSLCASRTSDLTSTLRRFANTSTKAYAGDRLSIVATCGADTRVFRLPGDWTFNMTGLEREKPKVAGLWTLESRIGKQAFGSFPFVDVVPPELDARLVTADDSILAELKSGRFDIGLPPGQSFKTDVAFRRTASDGIGASVRLIDADRFHFAEYLEPKYPPLARLARIAGKVELELGLSRDTGRVLEVKVLSGHPMLVDTAKEAAERWRFAGDNENKDSVRVTLEFVYRCP